MVQVDPCAFSSYLSYLEDRVVRLLSATIEDGSRRKFAVELAQTEVWYDHRRYIDSLNSCSNRKEVENVFYDMLGSLEGRMKTVIEACLSFENAKAAKDIIGRAIWYPATESVEAIIKSKNLM